MDILSLIIAVLPVIILGYYIYARDTQKESKGLIIKLIIGGVMSCFVTLFITGILQKIIPFFAIEHEDLSGLKLFISILFGVGVIEEFSKFLMAYMVGYNNKEFDETYDAILYCVFISLGFALFENILYVSGGGIGIGILRMFTSIPAHTIFGITMGYYYGKAKIAKITNTSGQKLYFLLAVWVPALIHAIYDYVAFSGMSGAIIFLFIIVAAIIASRKVNIFSKYNTYLFIKPKENTQINQQIQCPSCGSIENNNFCSKCGNKLKN